MTEKKVNKQEEIVTPETETVEEAVAQAAEEATEEQAQESEKQEDEAPAEPSPEEQLAELKDKYLRLMAEYDNYRKRTVREKTELLLSGGQSTVKAILPVLDDFERALADKTDDAGAVREGMALIFNKFNKSLEGLGVKKIEAVGAEFNTDCHEAIAMIPAPTEDMKGKVVDCVLTGYTMNDKVIRCAKVAVGQ